MQAFFLTDRYRNHGMLLILRNLFSRVTVDSCTWFLKGRRPVCKTIPFGVNPPPDYSCGWELR